MKLNDIWLMPYFYYNELVYKFVSLIKKQRLYIKYTYLKVCWKEFLKKVNDFDRVSLYGDKVHLYVTDIDKDKLRSIEEYINEYKDKTKKMERILYLV